MSRLIDQLRESDYPDRSSRDLTLEVGQWLEQNKRNDVFSANPDFAQEYHDIKKELDRLMRPSFTDEFKGAFGSAVDDLQAGVYNLGALAAHGAKEIGIPGATSARDKLLQLAHEQEEEAAQYKPSVGSYEDIESPSDLARYATFGLGTVAPSLIQSAVSGATGALAGAAAGSAATPGAGTAVGAVGGALLGLAEKRLAQKALSKLIERGTKNVTLAEVAKAIPREAVEAEAKRLSRSIGAQSALGATSIAGEVGSIYGENPDSPVTALTYGTIAGLLDVLPETFILSKFVRPGEAASEATSKGFKAYLRRFGETAAVAVPLEGGTEAAQTLLEIAAAKHARGEAPNSFTADDYRMALNAGLIGTLGGTAMSPVGALADPKSRLDPNAGLPEIAMGRIADEGIARTPMGEVEPGGGPMDFGQGIGIPDDDLGPLSAPVRQAYTADQEAMGGEGFAAGEYDPLAAGIPGAAAGMPTAPSQEINDLIRRAGGASGATAGTTPAVKLPKSIVKVQEAAERAAVAWEVANASTEPFPGEQALPGAGPMDFGELPVRPEEREQLGAPPSAQITDAPLGNLVGRQVEYQGYRGELIRDREGNFMVMPAAREAGKPFWIEVADTGKDQTLLASTVGVVPLEPANMTPKAAPSVAIPSATGAGATRSGLSKVPLGDLFPNDLVPRQDINPSIATEFGTLLPTRATPSPEPAPAVATEITPDVSTAPGAPVITPQITIPLPVVKRADPTGEMRVAAAGNGVPVIDDEATNIARMEFFEKPQPVVQPVDENGPTRLVPESAAPLGSEQTHLSGLAALKTAVGKRDMATSRAAAVIVDNDTGDVYVRHAYIGANNRIYLAKSQRKVGREGTFDFLNGKEGLPLETVLNVLGADGNRRFRIAGIATLTSAKARQNYNIVGGEPALLAHPGLARAFRAKLQEGDLRGPSKDALPAVPKFTDNVDESGRVMADFRDSIAAWSERHNDDAGRVAVSNRIDEFAAALAKQFDMPNQGKSFATSMKQAVGLKAKTRLNQTSRISLDYTVPVAATKDLFASTLRALTEGRVVDVAAFEKGFMSAVDGAAETMGVVISPDGKRKILAFAMSSIDGPITADTIIGLLHETGHHVTDGLPEALRVAFQDAIEMMPWQRSAGWLMNPRSLDIRLLANADPTHLSPSQREALERLTPEEIAVARRISPAALVEEQMAEHLAQLGWDKAEAKGAIQSLIRFVKELWLRMAMAVQTALKGQEHISPDLARRYVENRYLQFIHRDSALARDRINDLMTWLGAPATESQKIPVFPAGSDWDQRMQFVDVATGEFIPVKTGNYTPDAQAREIKLALDRAAQWVAEHPSGSTADTPELRFTQRAYFGSPQSSTPSIKVNGILAQINLEAETNLKIQKASNIAEVLPLGEDGQPLSERQFAVDWLGLPPEQTPEARKEGALKAAQQPDPLTGQPIAHQPDITIDELPSLEQKIVDKDGKTVELQITEAQDDAVNQAILSLRNTWTRVTAKIARDNSRYEELTRDKIKAAKTTGEFSSAAQYELSRLGEELVTRQRIALELNDHINRLLAKFRPGDHVNIYPGAEVLSVPSDSATEEQIRGNKPYRISKDYTYTNKDEISALGREISMGEAWLKNPDNRFKGQIYGVISETVRKLRQIPLNQERAAVSVFMRKIIGGFIDELNASGLPAMRAMGKRFAGAMAFQTAYREELKTLGGRWSAAFGRLAEAMGRPNDQAFVAEIWDPISRIWNFIDSSERGKLGTAAEADIFKAMERELKIQTGFEVKTEKQREALRALLMQSIEREKYIRQIFEQHPELQVFDKELKVYRRLFTHGLVTGSRGLRREMESLALRMNPAWSDTTGSRFWETAGDLYQSDRKAFDAKIATLFDGYVAEDFVAPLALNNVATFSVAGSDGQPRQANILNVRRAWHGGGGDVVKFAEILHRLEDAPDGMEGKTVGFVLNGARGRFEQLKNILDKQAAARSTGIETMPSQMLDGRDAADLPAQWLSYGTMGELDNLTLLDQLAMQANFGPTALAPAKNTNIDGDVTVVGGEMAESIHAAKVELRGIRDRFDQHHRAGLNDKQIKEKMGADDYGIALNADRSAAALDQVMTAFTNLHSVSNYLNTDIQAGNDAVGLMSTMALMNPRSGLQQLADVLGMLVDLKISSQTIRGLKSAIKQVAADIGNSVFEAFGQQAAFSVTAARRLRRVGAGDSETRIGWEEKTSGLGPRNRLGVPEGYESFGQKTGRNVSRVARLGRNIIPNLGNPFVKPGDEKLAPKLTGGVFHTLTHAAMRGSMMAGYDLFGDIATRGVEYLQKIPAAERAQFVKELELGIRDLGAQELGFYGGWLLNDKAAFNSLKTAIETQMAGERSVGDFVVKAYRRMEGAQREAEAGTGDGTWDVISDSQFVDIINYVNNQWTLQPNFATLPSFMQGPLRPLFIFLVWPYLAMRRAAKGFTDANQRMTWAGANSSVADGLKALFIIAAPATIAGSFAIDWYDKYLLGKKQNLREAPVSTAIPVLGVFLHPAAFVERWARYGTAGLTSDILNMAVNYDSQRTVSLDNRVFALNSISSLFNSLIKTPIQTEGNLTYASFGRPLIQAMGGGGVLHNLQIAQNLLGLNTQDAAINARINTGNYLRAAGRELDLPVRVMAGPQGVPTPITPYLQQMELAALVNNNDLFREAYRNAVQAAREDPDRRENAEKYVADNFAERHPLKRLFKGVVTEGDYRRMLGEMDEYGAGQVRAAINSYNRQLSNFFGKKAYYGKADKGGATVEELIRSANRINSSAGRLDDSLLAIP